MQTHYHGWHYLRKYGIGSLTHDARLHFKIQSAGVPFVPSLWIPDMEICSVVLALPLPLTGFCCRKVFCLDCISSNKGLVESPKLKKKNFLNLLTEMFHKVSEHKTIQPWNSNCRLFCTGLSQGLICKIVIADNLQLIKGMYQIKEHYSSTAALASLSSSGGFAASSLMK